MTECVLRWTTRVAVVFSLVKAHHWFFMELLNWNAATSSFGAVYFTGIVLLVTDAALFVMHGVDIWSWIWDKGWRG